MNVSLHSSSLQKKRMSCTYMAEAVHSSLAGLTALHWEAAKTHLNPSASLLGEGRLAEIFLSFNIHCSALGKE